MVFPSPLLDKEGAGEVLLGKEGLGEVLLRLHEPPSIPP